MKRGYLKALELRGASHALVGSVRDCVRLEGLGVVELDLAGVADVSVIGVRVHFPMVQACRLPRRSKLVQNSGCFKSAYL